MSGWADVIVISAFYLQAVRVYSVLRVLRL